jgi:long-subunit acyl-CoA synthetase (AMP-forming)
MYMGVTTVALYDTLGEEASKYIIDQTGLTTLLVSHDLVEKLLATKQADDHLEESEKKMTKLKNIIIMDVYDVDKALESYKISAEIRSKAHSC